MKYDTMHGFSGFEHQQSPSGVRVSPESYILADCMLRSAERTRMTIPHDNVYELLTVQPLTNDQLTGIPIKPIRSSFDETTQRASGKRGEMIAKIDLVSGTRPQPDLRATWLGQLGLAEPVHKLERITDNIIELNSYTVIKNAVTGTGSREGRYVGNHASVKSIGTFLQQVYGVRFTFDRGAEPIEAFWPYLVVGQTKIRALSLPKSSTERERKALSTCFRMARNAFTAS